MGLALIKISSDQLETSASDDLLKVISKFWNKKQWELYLKQFEGSQPKEEMYVGTTGDLEKFVARKSEFGSVPPATVDGGIKFKGEESRPTLKSRFGR
jgi:hypothetical protein